jgi:hypothetical protein
MLYKLLGFVVWQGARWYLRHRFPGGRAKLAVAGLTAAAVVGGVMVAQRRAGSE